MKQMKINYPHGRGGLNPSQVIGPYSDALRFGERAGRKSGPQNMHRLSGEACQNNNLFVATCHGENMNGLC